MNRLRSLVCFFLTVSILGSCAVRKYSTFSLDVEQDTILRTAHVGIKVVDLDNDKILFQHNSHHHFMPASNTKLLTMFTGLQLLGDSIPGWSVASDAQTIYVEPNGDPTFLNQEFPEQKLFDLLKNTNKSICVVLPENPKFGRFGLGWSWGSWQQTYSPERSVMPIYGNMVHFYKGSDNTIHAIPSYFDSRVEQPSGQLLDGYTSILRSEYTNTFIVRKNASRNSWIRPFTAVDNDSLSYILLKDTLKSSKPDVNIRLARQRPAGLEFRDFHTLPTDTLIRIMMKRSDNFFAEQILLMSSKIKFGRFDEAAIKKYIQEGPLKDVWVKGKWVDGSGLSRSNLISPDEFINLLKLMYRHGDLERVRNILPYGNDGTLKGYYLGLEHNISAKTGTLTDHLALSGYLITKSDKKLAFSFLINNHRSNPNAFRKEIARYLTHLIEKY